jgi:hypothetical protein
MKGPQDIIPERPELPEELKNTDIHVVQPNLGLVGTPLKMVPDIETGGERCKRLGVWLAMNVMPFLDKQIQHQDQPLILPEPPPILIVGDSMEEVKSRIIYEVDLMLDTAQGVISGDITFDEEPAAKPEFPEIETVEESI